MSYWKRRATDLIAELIKDLPEGATVVQRKAVLWGQGWPAHQNTSWGKKMWGKAVREHLAHYGPVHKVKAFQRYSPITGQYEMVDLTLLTKEEPRPALRATLPVNRVGEAEGDRRCA